MYLFIHWHICLMQMARSILDFNENRFQKRKSFSIRRNNFHVTRRRLDLWKSWFELWVEQTGEKILYSWYCYNVDSRYNNNFQSQVIFTVFTMAERKIVSGQTRTVTDHSNEKLALRNLAFAVLDVCQLGTNQCFN